MATAMTRPGNTTPGSTAPGSTAREDMVAPAEVRPDVLPTERLTPSGKAVADVRADLRRIADARNIVTVLGAFAQTYGVVVAAVWISHPVAWVAAFFLMGRAMALQAILSHEAAHRLLFSKRWLNDFVGKWMLSYPAFVPFDLYRRSHFGHHRDEMGPEEPDVNLYQGYPITSDSMRRKLTRDAVGISGWKNLKGLFRALGSAQGRRFALRIFGAQAVLIAAATAASRPWLYVVLWLAPHMTVWRVVNRLRAIAEHGGLIRSKDRRATTHHVHQGYIARFVFAPYNTGWHLAHHVDMGVPWRNLPRFHRLLEEEGYVVDGFTYPSYLALWRDLASRPHPT